MKFGKIINGEIVEAPSDFTSEGGKYIEHFSDYLNLMHSNGLKDRMYGYKDIEELTKISVEEQISKLEEHNEKLKVDQETQNSLIDVNLMANMEIYEIILNMVPQPVSTFSLNARSTSTMSEEANEGGSSMVEVYVASILRGLITIDKVPTLIRPQVEKRLNDLDIPYSKV